MSPEKFAYASPSQCERRPIEKIAYLFGLYRRFIMSIKHSAASRLSAVLAFATVFVFAFISLVAVAAAQPYGQGQGGPGNMMGGGWGWGMGYGMGGVGGIGVLVLGLVVLGIAFMAFRRRSP
jgi:hypothetical protein